jgi:hypothetical protein
VGPVESTMFGIYGPLESARVLTVRYAVDFPDERAREKFAVRLGEEPAYPGRDRGGPVVALAPPEALCEETIEGVAESHAVVAVHPRDDPAVDFAVGILDLLRGFGTELEHEKLFAIETEYLGALVLVGIPRYVSRQYVLSSEVL